MNPAFCRVHGAGRQGWNEYLQSGTDGGFEERGLEMLRGELEEGVIELEEKCGTRLPSEAESVSVGDVEDGFVVGGGMTGRMVRGGRRRRRGRGFVGRLRVVLIVGCCLFLWLLGLVGRLLGSCGRGEMGDVDAVGLKGGWFWMAM